MKTLSIPESTPSTSLTRCIPSFLSFNSASTTIQYLSLKSSRIKNISFLSSLPNIYYLDLSHNPIQSFIPFEHINTFGYLSLTAPEGYLERQILSIRKLCVCILDLPIKDEVTKHKFMLNNPNVCVFNNEFIHFGMKIDLYIKYKRGYTYNNNHEVISNEQEINTIHDIDNKHKWKNKSHLFKDKYNIGSNNIVNEIDNERMLLHYHDKIKVKSTINNANSKIKEIISFINEYNSKMIHTYIQYLHINKHLPCYNGNIERIIPIEKEMCLFMWNIYMHINSINPTTYKEEFNMKLFIMKNAYNQMIIITFILLYIIGLLSKELTKCFMCLFIEEIYTKEYKTTLKSMKVKYIEKQVSFLLETNLLYIICFCCLLYDKFIQFDDYNTHNNRNIKIKFLIMNINHILTYHKEACLVYSNNNEYNNSNKFKTKNDYINNTIISFIKHKINYFNESLGLVHFINDYIIHNNYGELLSKNHSNHLQTFVDIKNSMFKICTRSFSLFKESIAEQVYHNIKAKSNVSNRASGFIRKKYNTLNCNCYISSPNNTSLPQSCFNTKEGFYRKSYQSLSSINNSGDLNKQCSRAFSSYSKKNILFNSISNETNTHLDGLIYQQIPNKSMKYIRDIIMSNVNSGDKNKPSRKIEVYVRNGMVRKYVKVKGKDCHKRNFSCKWNYVNLNMSGEKGMNGNNCKGGK